MSQNITINIRLDEARAALCLIRDMTAAENTDARELINTLALVHDIAADALLNVRLERKIRHA